MGAPSLSERPISVESAKKADHPVNESVLHPSDRQDSETLPCWCPVYHASKSRPEKLFGFFLSFSGFAVLQYWRRSFLLSRKS